MDFLMPVNVYDNKGNEYIIGENFYLGAIHQPLVTEHKTRYSFPFGDAELHQIAFSGIYILYGDMMMREARKLHFNFDGDMKLIELHYTLQGSGTVFNNNTGKSYTFNENECNMHYTPNFSGTGEYLKDLRYRFFEVHFTREFFGELAEGSSALLTEFADKTAQNKTIELSTNRLPITFSMRQCIREIINCSLKGRLKLFFLQSKCIELLALQAQAHEAGESNSSIVTYDKDRIYFAKDYLLEHAEEPPSLTELARIAGINEFKLKKGFKELFQNTVFGYLNDYRLQEAKERLMSGNVAIKDVADQFGFSSVQHFSKAFKQKFGTPPGRFSNHR